MLKEKLGISQEQYDKLEKSRRESGEKMKALGKELRDKRMAFGEALGKTGNESELKKLHKEVKDLTSKMADTMFDGMMYLRKVLTPEQLAKFHEMMPGRKGKHAMMPGMMPGMMGKDGPDAKGRRMGPDGERKPGCERQGKCGQEQGCACAGGKHEGMMPPPPPEGEDGDELMPPPGAEDINDDAECNACGKAMKETPAAPKEAKEKK